MQIEILFYLPEIAIVYQRQIIIKSIFFLVPEAEQRERGSF